MYEDNWNFQRCVGVLEEKNPFYGEGMDILGTTQCEIQHQERKSIIITLLLLLLLLLTILFLSSALK